MFLLIFLSLFNLFIRTNQLYFFQDEKVINGHVFKIIFKQDQNETVHHFIDGEMIEEDSYKQALADESIKETQNLISEFEKKCFAYKKQQEKSKRDILLKTIKLQTKEVLDLYRSASHPSLSSYLAFSENTIVDEGTFNYIRTMLTQLNSTFNKDPDLQDLTIDKLEECMNELDDLFERLSKFIEHSKQRVLEFSDDTKHLKALLEL